MLRTRKTALPFHLLAALLLLALQSACRPAGAATLPPPQVTRLYNTLAPASATAPTVNPLPPGTPVTTNLPPTLAPTFALHPMSIAAGRLRSYPGSQIEIEETLERGLNYSRYYASYLSEGLKIYALLTIPDGDPPPGGWPGIVFIHGYIPPAQYRTTERYIAYVDGLARRGYMVFRIDLRGHDRSQGAANGAYSDPGYTTDVLNAITSLQSFPLADPERIGLWGHSMGGFLALRAMVISPQIRAAVIWAGVLGSYPDMLERWRRGPLAITPPPARFNWRQSWVEAFGSPQENPAFWSSISATSYLAEVSAPLQLHHALDDDQVPAFFSQELYQQLLTLGKTVEYYAYKDDDHNLSNSFSQAMTRTLFFYDRYLKADGE